jgi:hypothetical protein
MTGFIDKERIESLLEGNGIHQSGVIIKVLCECIILNIPKKDWPSIVTALYQEQVSEIVNCNPQAKESVDWDDQPLGDMSDIDIGKRVGRSSVAVGKARKRRGIPPFSQKNRSENQRAPGQRAGIDWDKQPLWDVPESELARRLGVDRSSVRSAKLYREKRKSKSNRPIGKSAGIDWDKQPIGKVPNKVLARKLGVSPASVRSAIKTRNRQKARLSGSENRATEPDSESRINPDNSKPKPQTSEAKKAEPMRNIDHRLIPAWPWAQPPSKTAKGSTKVSDDHRHEKYQEIPVESPNIEAEPHVHKCPVCFSISDQCSDPECEPSLELPDGTPMCFRTCEDCLSKMKSQPSYRTVRVNGRRFKQSDIL